MDVRLPDGTMLKGVPDGMSKADLVAKLKTNGYDTSGLEPQTTIAQDIKQGAGNIAAGLVRGAGSIGATIMAPKDMLMDAIGGKGLSLESNRQRRDAMDAALGNMGAETDSYGYAGGKLAGEIAGTAGAGGAVANTIAKVAPRVASAAPAVLDAIRTGGFSVNGAKGVPAVLARATGGAVTGGVSAGLVDPSQAGAGAAIGGAIPVLAQGAGTVARAVGRKISGGPVSQEVADLAGRAKQLGIDIPADRIANSKPLNAIASSLNYVPFSGRAATEEKMFNQLNSALSKTVGQDSPNVTQALRKANSELGSKFDEVLQANTLKITPEFKAALDEAENQATNELGQDGASIIHKQIASILSKGTSGEIDGQAAYNIKKTLDRIGQRNTPEAFYARDLKKNLMDALNDSLGPQEAAAFKGVRQQYGNMLKLEKLAQNGAEGDISIGRLANMKNINSPDLQELADIAAQFLKSRESNHSAMQRVMGGGLAAGSLFTAPIATSAMIGGAKATNMLMNSNAAKNLVLGKAATPSVNNALQKFLPLSYQAGQLIGQ